MNPMPVVIVIHLLARLGLRLRLGLSLRLGILRLSLQASVHLISQNRLCVPILVLDNRRRRRHRLSARGPGSHSLSGILNPGILILPIFVTVFLNLFRIVVRLGRERGSEQHNAAYYSEQPDHIPHS
jgi:hypothetical protein